MTALLPFALGVPLLLAATAPALVHRLRRDAGWLLGAGLALSAALLAPLVPGVLAGEPVGWSVPWVPGLGLDLALRLDGLALVFAGLVLGVGALVLAYSARYLGRDWPGTRMYVLLAAFAAAMLLLVLADDVIVLYVGWEATSIVSFLLIGGDGRRGSLPALRAFMVTATGGFALLAGLVLMAQAAGTTQLSVILADGSSVVGSPTGAAAAVLVLLGVATKSALLPFGFWLRGAMVAPTPVSTYLHAATMVKAGIYLLARMTPALADIPLWEPTLLVAGLATTALGGVQALRAHDLKALLAGSTVSQLGFIAAVLGVGTPAALTAGVLHTIAHAAFKGSLFMVAGVVDHQVGQRDIRVLAGLRHQMPVTAAVALVASLSMAGVPPLLGFVSKEEVFTVFAELGSLVLVAGAATTILTVAYTLRFWFGTFGGHGERTVDEGSSGFLLGPAILALVGLVAGLAVPLLDPLLAASTRDAALAGEVEPHLALWHGLNAPLIGSIAALLLGWLLWVERTGVADLLSRSRDQFDGARRFDGLYAWLQSVGRHAAAPFLPPTRARHLVWVFATTAALLIAAVPTGGRVVAPVAAGTVAEWIIAVVLAATGALIILVRSRLGAAALLGSVGFLLTVFWVLRGAPDLALTQLLVESLTVVLIVLVFRRLPDLQPPLGRPQALLAGVVAGATGLAAIVGVATLLGSRPLSDAAEYYLSSALDETGGSNVVNTILVDFRALDTLGEISVLVVAAVGVYAVVGRRRGATMERGGRRRARRAASKTGPAGVGRSEP